jgi:DNA-binding response OmpR family regulator
MGLVLWIDSNTFASALLEKVFRKKGFEFYTVSHARDFLYLVEDLKPAVIVLDALTVKQDLEIFRNQYESSEQFRKTPIVVIGGWTGLEFIQKKKGDFPRTFDPFAVPDALKAL